MFLGLVMDRDERDVRAQQPVVAIAVGGRLDDKFQRLGDLQRRRGRRGCRPMQQIHYVCAAGDLFIEGHGAGLGDRLQTVQSDHREHLDELPVPVRVAREPLAQARHCTR